MNLENELNETLREHCCNGNMHEVLKALERGAEVNSGNKVNGWTALHWASKRGHKAILELLLTRGADPGLKNRKGELPKDLTDRPDLITLLEVVGSDSSKTESEGMEKTGEAEEKKTEVSRGGTVSFVPGYLANPVFPYAVATGNILTQTVPSTKTTVENEQPVLLPGYLAKPVLMATAKPVVDGAESQSADDNKNEQQVLVPGYLANPVFPCAMATGSSIITENESAEDDKAKHESPMNFVPGYLMGANNSLISKNEVPEEFKQIFVPHVQQLGSLVNTYVNSMKSQEKPVEYRLYNSCKTTPVATVFVSTPVSEVVLKIRIADREEDFIEVELNSKLLTYEELVNVCIKELQVTRSQISKIRKLPNTVIRRDKDVKRLQPFQELEVILE